MTDKFKCVSRGGLDNCNRSARPFLKRHLIGIPCLVIALAGFGCDDSKSSSSPKCTPECMDENTALVCKDNQLEFDVCSDRNLKCFDGVCAAASNVSCTDAPRECVDKYGYRVCANGFWSEKIECAEDDACVDGACISSSDVCEPDDKRCSSDNKGYQICTGREHDDITGTWSSVFDCPKGTVCQYDKRNADAECVPASEKCTTTKPECTADNKGYRVCVSGSWSEVIECTGTTVCKDGQCAGEDVTSTLPCQTIGEQKCLSKTRVQVCSPDKFWQFTDCPPDIPVCDAETQQCSVALCSAGQKKCSDEETLATCVDNAWEYNECPADKPVCKNNECQEKPKECTPGQKKCTEKKMAAQCNDAGHWETEYCTGDSVCSDGICRECTENDSKCADDYHSVIECKNGKWTKSECPSNAPYCPLGTNDCISIQKEDSCQVSFSFCYNGSLDFCAYNPIWVLNNKEVGYYGNNIVWYTKCNSECVYAKDGIGATCADSDWKNTCTNVGETKTETSFASGYDTFKGGYNKNYNTYNYYHVYRKVSCSECKAMSDGSARWVPVDWSHCVKNM